jgi:SAM-dependent methyltransferase
MAGQFQHPMLVTRTHDEEARQAYALAIRRHLAANVAGGNRLAYARRAEPAFVKAHGRAPKDRHEVREVMTKDAYYQLYSLMQRHTQEQTFDSVIDSVERQLPELIAKARQFSGKAGGTLRLDPGLEVPAYHTAYDIHLQPGGYHTEFTVDDVAEGALYDRSVYLYAMGNLGPIQELFGRSLIAYYKRLVPGAKPRRILDMGCTVGHSTLAWKRAFPEAEVYAIDVAAPCLRYAHARAEALGVPIHFSQQNAEFTDFPDGFFDVVCSHIIMHETSTRAAPHIFGESRRILAPGGTMLHMDNPRLGELSPIDGFLAEWEVTNNNESFGGTYRAADLAALGRQGGWPAEQVVFDYVPLETPPQVMNYTTKAILFPCVTARKDVAVERLAAE